MWNVFHVNGTLGLGHAVLCAERAVGNEPFALLLADDFLTNENGGVTANLARAFEVSGKTQIMSWKVNGPDISKYGVVVPNVQYGSVAGLVKNLLQIKLHPTWPVLVVIF